MGASAVSQIREAGTGLEPGQQVLKSRRLPTILFVELAEVWLSNQAGPLGGPHKDAIRRRPMELQALTAHGVRTFCHTNVT
jgi:hypothetical protein